MKNTSHLSLYQLLARADIHASHGDRQSVEFYDLAIAKLIAERNVHAVAIGDDTVEVTTVRDPDDIDWADPVYDV